MTHDILANEQVEITSDSEDTDATEDLEQTHPEYEKASIISRYIAANIDTIIISALTVLFYYILTNIINVPEHSNGFYRAMFLGFYTIYLFYYTLCPLLPIQSTIGGWIMRIGIVLKKDKSTMEVERSFLRSHIVLISLAPMLVLYYVGLYYSIINPSVLEQKPEFEDFTLLTLIPSLILAIELILVVIYGSFLIIYWSLSLLFLNLDYTESPQDYLCKTLVYKKPRVS